MSANKKYVPSKRVASGKFYKSLEERAAVRVARVAERDSIQAEKEAAAAAIIAAEEAAKQAIIDKAADAQAARAAEKARIKAEKEAVEAAAKQVIIDKAAAEQAAERAVQEAYAQSPRGLLECIVKARAGISLTQDTLTFDENFIGSKFYFSPWGSDNIIFVPAERPLKIGLEELFGEKAQEERRLKKVAAQDAAIAATAAAAAVIAKAEADKLAEEKAAEERIAAEEKAAEERIAAEKKAAEERIAAEEKAAEKKAAQDAEEAAKKKILLKARAKAAAIRRADREAARKEYSKTPRGRLELQIKRVPGVDMVEDNLLFNEGYIGPTFYLPDGEEIQIPEERPVEIDIAHLV